ncbi:MAG: hypothetical protein JW891_05210 [Candidatus Lokiarchaeota archaeon]|nr:hypothetical protein [Candidatus Lokiarchaeota archaeon]
MIKRNKIILGIILLSSILVPSVSFGIYACGNTPVHRINNRGIDPVGDVSNPDIDIVEYRSHGSSDGSTMIVEINVLGKINESYSYRFTVVAKTLSDTTGHIYSFLFNDGECDEGFITEIENSTIRMIFPMSRLSPTDYVIGIEVLATDIFERDLTPEVRNASIAHLYW